MHSSEPLSRRAWVERAARGTGVFCVGAIFLPLPVSGETSPRSPTSAEGGGEAGPATAPPPVISLAVELVAGSGGEALHAGEMGWLQVSISNTTSKQVCVPTACRIGKHYQLPVASFNRWGRNAAFALAPLTCEFSLKESKARHVRVLDPPDDPIVLQAGETRDVWRSVMAPPEPGVYRLEIKLNTCDILNMQLTYNAGVPQHLFSVSAVAEGVRILEAVRRK